METRSQHQEEFCAFSEVTRSYQKLDVQETDFNFTVLLQKRTGLRMDGIPALDLRDFVIEEFHSSPNQANEARDVREPRGILSATPQSNIRKQIPTTNTNLDVTNIDHVSSSGTHSGSNAMLYVFEDSEVVIKMIIKGRSPTMRHVSRATELVWIGCLAGEMLILKFRFDMLIPNIISQTF